MKRNNIYCAIITICTTILTINNNSIILAISLGDYATTALDLVNELTNSLTMDTMPEIFDNDPDTHRTIAEIIRSRQFECEEHDVITRDGYILSIQRIVNPLIEIGYKNKLKPVILQHGLLSSGADFVINSVNVRPAIYPLDLSKINNSIINDNNNDNGIIIDNNRTTDTQQHPNSLGFYLANLGYDVWIANSRGNIYGQRHTTYSSWDPRFWSFSFDEQIKYDLPDIISYVQQVTKRKKVGYVGHSQGTVMGFGLLADQPEYADIIEPFVALAPVAYVHNSISPVKYFAIYTPIFEQIDSWFGTSNIAVKYLAPLVCSPEIIRKDICSNIIFLGCGFDEDELNENRVAAYLNHVPSGTSIKNIAHYGQEVLSRKFQHFDHGYLGNLYKYGQIKPPIYDLTKIRSKSIALIFAENDWLASPKDVARLRRELTVPIYDLYNVTEIKPKWNHIDYVYGKDAGTIINPRIEKIMNAFRNTE